MAFNHDLQISAALAFRIITALALMLSFSFPLESTMLYNFDHRISAAFDIRGYVGENVELRCTFKSSSYVTDKLTIDCKYRPPSSSRTKSVFHYQSFQYPTTAGTFQDQISWAGNVYKGDASISISNPNLIDNSTFSCAVKNLPDVHHDIPLMELTITERGFGTMLSSVALLSILVFIPSAVVIVLMLVRISRKAAEMKKQRKSGYKKKSWSSRKMAEEKLEVKQALP
ncbi:myelin protein zero-like protein 3 [Dipodomys merriami]|uniref:myelin protein zero-like protein 3 n=1 Tax=Dipodomys merriami TaxID=94247 RepID=UPI003855BF42